MNAPGTPGVGLPPFWRTLSTVWLGLCVVLGGVVAALGPLAKLDAPTHLYLLLHDLPVAALGWVILAFGPALAVRAAGRLPGGLNLPPRTLMLLLAGAVAVTAYAGVEVVFGRHPLSMDEFMAVFDARIFREGRLWAEVAPEWRPYLPALQPLFVAPGAGNAWWTSAYLPVNAMLRAGFERLGDGAFAGPAWAGLSVVLTYAVGRRLRPERPAYALVAAVLLAGSAQLLITAMTPYAMSAHLALNLLWLLLLLRGGVLGHGAAMLTALLATGLHQLLFHPLFAAPFVLKLWWERRWGPAAAHTLAYLVIGLFWTSYPALFLPAGPVEDGRSLRGVLEIALALAGRWELSDVTYTAANLVRFVVWQNPLTVPLLVLSVLAGRRLDGTERALWGGLLLTLAAMAVILPYQGHGWGYRYVHGLLGSACLLAAGAWLRLLDGCAEPERGRSWAAFGGVSAAAALLLLPLQAWQTRAYVRPYAAAARAVAGADADVVVVDDTDFWFGADLVRNDPFLRNRPKVMLRGALRPEQAAELCRTRRVAGFDKRDAARFGIRTAPGPDQPPVCPR